MTSLMQFANDAGDIAYAYLSNPEAALCDTPTSVTDWSGAIVGTVVKAKRYRLTRTSYTHGNFIYSVQVRDLDGIRWYGRGNAGLCITLRRYKRQH